MIPHPNSIDIVSDLTPMLRIHTKKRIFEVYSTKDLELFDSYDYEMDEVCKNIVFAYSSSASVENIIIKRNGVFQKINTNDENMFVCFGLDVDSSYNDYDDFCVLEKDGVASLIGKKMKTSKAYSNGTFHQNNFIEILKNEGIEYDRHFQYGNTDEVFVISKMAVYDIYFGDIDSAMRNQCVLDCIKESHL